MRKLTFIDLFCGCGGFSLGLERAGLAGVTAIDFNEEAIVVFKKNLPQIPYILQTDVTRFSPKDLVKMTGIPEVDLIVGGPPCQGFSAVRQVDGANHGSRAAARLPAPIRRQLFNSDFAFMKFTIRPSKKAGCGFTLTVDGKYHATFGTRQAAKDAAKELADKPTVQPAQEEWTPPVPPVHNFGNRGPSRPL